MEPKGNEQVGWNTDFVGCIVFKVTAKRIGILSPYLGILWLNREAFECDGKVYHSKPHEWFYKVKPDVDPEQPGRKYYNWMAKSNGTPEAFNTLGLKVGCTKTDIKRAYKKLARQRHPDFGGSHEAFIKLNEAYEAAMKII
jgi:hypothetical protein